MSAIHLHHVPIRAVSPCEHHCFFGYFDKSPWDTAGNRLLAHALPFTARQPLPGERATLGVIFLNERNRFQPIAESDAWCWQQGCMLQWLPGADDKVIFNDRKDNRFISRIVDLRDGSCRNLPRPVYCISPDGRFALSLNFSRLDRERPGYGYPGGEDPTQHIPIPDDDGIFLMDLESGESKLIVSIAEVTEKYYRSDMRKTPGWFNHLLFNTDGSRFAFFHRWRLWTAQGEPTHLTQMFTADRDGDRIFPLNLEDMSSHYSWCAPDRLINFARRFAEGDQYYFFNDFSVETQSVAPGIFPGDGHCTISPNGEWMLTDSYPLDDHCRRLYLYHLDSRQAYEIGCFYADPTYSEPTRCDLHPRFSRDGRSVCIDSIHEGSRRIYLLDVSELTQEGAK